MNVVDKGLSKFISFPNRDEFTSNSFTLSFVGTDDVEALSLVLNSDNGIDACNPTIQFSVDTSTLSAGEYRVTLSYSGSVYGRKLLYVDSTNRDFSPLGSDELESVTILGS